MYPRKIQVAGTLLEIGAVKLQPRDPFTWASGRFAPIYCNNRKAMTSPETREEIVSHLRKLLLESEELKAVETIAAVSTSGILWGALLADDLGLNFVYVRPDKKGHGTQGQIEGDIDTVQGTKAVVVEDLISTGGSSLKVVDALRDNGVEVLGMIAIFTYGFPDAAESFKKSDVWLGTLTDYDTLLEVAISTDYISADDVATLKEWRKDPLKWSEEQKT